MAKVAVWVVIIFLAIGAGLGAMLMIEKEGSLSGQSLRDISSATYKKLPLSEAVPVRRDALPQDWQTLWVADFKGNRIMGFSRSGKLVWEQHMASSPLPSSGYNTHAEYVSVAPNGNIVVADGEGMMVQELDRQTHQLLWQYGVKDVQGSANGLLHQPDKVFKINDYEVLVNDGNNRRVIIIDQRTNEIVWQYGETLKMGSKPGLLRGNTGVVPINEGQQMVITDTLEKKVLVVDRATKQIVWEWTKDDAKWLQHAWPTTEGGVVMEDRQKHEVFEVSAAGEIVWLLDTLSDGSRLRYPTDVIKLANGNVLVAEAGRGRVIEVVPISGEVVNEIKGVGFVTTIAIE